MKYISGPHIKEEIILQVVFGMPSSILFLLSCESCGCIVVWFRRNPRNSKISPDHWESNDIALILWSAELDRGLEPIWKWGEVESRAREGNMPPLPPPPALQEFLCGRSSSRTFFRAALGGVRKKDACFSLSWHDQWWCESRAWITIWVKYSSFESLQVFFVRWNPFKKLLTYRLFPRLWEDRLYLLQFEAVALRWWHPKREKKM